MFPLRSPGLATRFMFLISWRGYWAGIDRGPSSGPHQRPPARQHCVGFGVTSALALSIVSSPCVGLAPSLWVTSFTYGAFLIPAYYIREVRLTASLPPNSRRDEPSTFPRLLLGFFYCGKGLPACPLTVCSLPVFSCWLPVQAVQPLCVCAQFSLPGPASPAGPTSRLLPLGSQNHVYSMIVLICRPVPESVIRSCLTTVYCSDSLWGRAALGPPFPAFQ